MLKKKKSLFSFKIPMSLYNIVYVFSYLPMFRISAIHTLWRLAFSLAVVVSWENDTMPAGDFGPKVGGRGGSFY